MLLFHLRNGTYLLAEIEYCCEGANPYKRNNNAHTSPNYLFNGEVLCWY